MSESHTRAERTFKSQRYDVRCSTTDDAIAVGVEDLTTGEQWRGDFTARFIEDELTRRTGSFKKFKMFARMLEMAISNSAQSLFIDLLTYADLQALRSGEKIAGGDASSVSDATSRSGRGGKRYLILTYTAEFDRVNYPLPLEYVEDAQPDAMKRVVKRLREELEATKREAQQQQRQSAPAARRLAEENDALRKELEALRAAAVERTTKFSVSADEREEKLQH